MDKLAAIKVHKAMANAPGMDRAEIDAFLSGSRTPLRLATTDSRGEPNIHPVWYQYLNERIYLMSIKDAVKVRNLTKNRTVYFSVDTDAVPNRGVKGKGVATIVRDQKRPCRYQRKLSRNISEISTVRWRRA